MHYKKITIHTLRYLLASLLAGTMFGASAYAADTHYKPFVLGSVVTNSDVSSIAASVKQKLTANGFQIAGSYSPYDGATIIVVTNDELKKNAAASSFGAFGAIERVAVTKTDKGIQVSYTNPLYMANAYQMKSDLEGVSKSLATALGHEKQFGSEEGLTKKELRDYHYKWLMPYFTDRLNLASYSDYQKAINTVEKNLKSNKPGVSQVYRVDLPGKQETIIGLKMPGKKGTECSGDKYTMSRIDFKPTKSTAHLPYEIVINEGKIVALPAEFRIAINFPDLSMMGSNSFASIMCAPDAYKKALSIVAGGDTDY